MHELRKSIGIFKYMIILLYMSKLNTLAYLIVKHINKIFT